MDVYLCKQHILVLVCIHDRINIIRIDDILVEYEKTIHVYFQPSQAIVASN
jgi:hypothetical protein